MAVEMKDIAKLYIALFGRTPEGDGLAYWYQQAADNNWDMAELAQAMYTAALQYEDYSSLSDPKELVEAIYENVLGKTYKDDPEGIDYWVGQIKSGNITPGEIASVIIKTAEEQYPEHPATKTLENRAELALYVAQKLKTFTGDFTEFKKFAEMVNDDPTSVELAKKMVDSYVKAGVDGLLSDGPDYVQGSKYDDVFVAPLTQNELGQVVNTLDSGDVIKGDAGTDVLKADISYTVTGSNNMLDSGSPAIAPTIQGVEKLEFTAQYISTDQVPGHGSNLDAGKISGVQEIWDVNSRANVKIEDVRELPEDLTFGMKDTDPGVSYCVFFDPEQVTEGRTSKSNSTLTIVLDDLNSDELDNFSINGVIFKLDGKEYKIQTEDGSPIGKTYEDFAQNLQKLIDQNPDLAGRLQVKYEGGDTITITDTKGGEFQPVGFTWVDNIVPSDGALEWKMVAGAPIEEKAPVETTLILDNVGRTSQGGSVDIGSMGEGGIQVMDVKVDRSSWLTSIVSKSDMGDGDDILETVKLYSIGANGDLTVGDRVKAPDERVEDGFTNVKEVLNVDFKGNLKYGVTLTDEAISKYLDKAKDVVKFQYDGGAGNDLITIKDNSEHDSLSADPFFSMAVNLGNGDDKLVLDMANVKQVSIDGGEGNNTIAVSNSHGTSTDNTFKSFTNIQTYEIEAKDATEHKFDSMPSVKHVVVDTHENVDTTLIHLPIAADVTISGKWQTLDDTDADQKFGTVSIQAAKTSTDDRTLRVILENTARYDGKLTVNKLEVTDYKTEKSQIDTLELVSSGERKTSNIVNDLDASGVDNFKVSGTQALNVDLTSAAHYAETNPADRHSLTFDASNLTGDLTLQMKVAIPSNINGNTNASVTIKGGQSANDELVLYGTKANITADTSVSDIEKVLLGRDGGKADAIDGSINVSKFVGVNEYDVYHTDANLTLAGLSGSENIVVNIDNGQIGGLVRLDSAEQDSTNTATVVLKDFDANPDFTGNIAIATKDFAGIVVDLVDNGSQINGMDINLLDVDGNDVSKVVLKGGLTDSKGIDQVNLHLNNIDNDSLKTLDISGFDGVVKDIMINTNAGDNNVTVYLNKWGGSIWEQNSASESTNVVYKINSEMVKTVDGGVESWIITGFETGDGSGNEVDATDKSVIDVSGIGIDNIADLSIANFANKALYKDSSGNYNLDGNGNIAWTTSGDTAINNADDFIVAVDFGSDNSIDVKTALFDKDTNGDGIISEKELGVDLDHNGQLSDSKGIALAFGNADIDSDGNADTFYVIYFDIGPNPSTLLPLVMHDDQAIYNIAPNDSTQHAFDFLIGVNDGAVALDEDFFNGL